MTVSLRYVLLAIFVLMIDRLLYAQRTYNLNECIAIALEKNIALEKAMLGMENKKLDIKSYKNERLPNLNGYTNLYTNFGQSQDIFGNNARNDNFNSTLGLSTSYSILNNGKLRNSIKRAEREWEASAQDLILFKRELTLKTIQGYLQVLLQKEVGESIDSSLLFAEKQLQKVERSTELGATSLTILYEAKANYEREKEKNRQAHYAINKALLELRQVMGLDTSAGFDIETISHDLPPLMAGTEEKSDLYNSFLNGHPVSKKYSLLNEALLLEEKVISSQRYPSIDASVTLGSFYFNNLTTAIGKIPLFPQLQNNFSQQVGLAINVPIFNKHTVKVALQKNKIQQEENRKQLDLEKLALKQDLQKQFLDLANYQQQYRLATNVLEVTKKAFDLSLKSYEAGRISIYDLNTSRSNLLTVESELIQAKYYSYFTHLLIHYLLTGEVN